MYSIKIPLGLFTRNEESLVKYLFFFILETIILGRALNVNPYDQPSVELIKKETKKIFHLKDINKFLQFHNFYLLKF